MSTCARNMYRHEIKLIVKQILCINLVNYRDKYTEMHGQQNVKKINTAYCIVASSRIYDQIDDSLDNGRNI